MKPYQPRVLAALLSACAGAAVAIAAASPQQGGPQPAVALAQVTEAPPPPGEEGPLVPEGPAPDIALLYTGGVVGYVEPCG